MKQVEQRKPLNPRVKISAGGRPFVERNDLVAGVLKENADMRELETPCEPQPPRELFVQLTPSGGTISYVLDPRKSGTSNRRRTYVYHLVPDYNDR